MIIYDQTSIAFIQKSEAMLRSVIQDAGLTVRRSRFEYANLLYPIHVVVFEGSELAHFNAAYLQIGLNRKLISSAKDSVLRDILKHELAHYLTFIDWGEVPAHGEEYKKTCQRFGFSEKISHSTMNVENENLAKVGDLASEKVLEKVKKLLQLAQSSNSHEAELATLKANELLLRHNLDFIRDNQDEEPVYMDRLLYQKRKDAKLAAIYDILRHFIVKPVISYGKDICCLEVSGSYTNVTLARYVADFLNRELEALWEKTKSEHGLQGLRAKNSFFMGVAAGFDQKMKAVKVSFSEVDQKSLMVVEKKLTHSVHLIYRRLSQSSSGAKTDGHANSLGVEKGKKLSIRPGVEGKARNLFLPS